MTENPSLLVLAQTEETSTNPECGNVQTDAPENVCIRTEGHVGPHVGLTDDVYLQWES